MGTPARITMMKRSRTMMMMLRSPSRRLLSASKVKCYNAFLYPTITPPNSHSLHHIRPTCIHDLCFGAFPGDPMHLWSSYERRRHNVSVSRPPTYPNQLLKPSLLLHICLHCITWSIQICSGAFFVDDK